MSDYIVEWHEREDGASTATFFKPLSVASGDLLAVDVSKMVRNKERDIADWETLAEFFGTQIVFGKVQFEQTNLGPDKSNAYLTEFRGRTPFHGQSPIYAIPISEGRWVTPLIDYMHLAQDTDFGEEPVSFTTDLGRGSVPVPSPVEAGSSDMFSGIIPPAGTFLKSDSTSSAFGPFTKGGSRRRRRTTTRRRKNKYLKKLKL
jgi:hypothetical protein